VNATCAPWLCTLADGDPNAAVRVQSVWDFCVKGGPVMIPLGICSLVAMAILIERLVSLRRHKIIPPDFMSGLESSLRRGGDGMTAALAYCEKDGSPIANVFAAGIKRLGLPLEILERHIQESGEREVGKLRKNLRALSLLASVAPLLGLLGTILGMITAFQTVAASGEALGKTELLAKGIYEAMITTAAGLMIAIPVVICYHYFASRIDRLVGEIDQMTVKFVEEYAMPGMAGKVVSKSAPLIAPPQPEAASPIATVAPTA